jgi:hypothetical protein
MTDAKPNDPAVDLNSQDPTKGAKPAAGAATNVEIEVDGKKITVQPEVKAALDAAAKAAKDAGVAAAEVEKNLKAQLDEIKAKLPKDPPQAGDPLDGIDTLLFSDPKKAAQLIKEQAKEEIRAEMGQTNAQTQFWTDFYGAFPELKQDELVVKAIMGRDFADLKPLKVADAIQKLGESTQKYLLDRGVKREPVKKGDKTEGGTESGSKGTKKDDVSKDSPNAGGLTAVLKERQAARRAARTGAAAS